MNIHTSILIVGISIALASFNTAALAYPLILSPQESKSLSVVKIPENIKAVHVLSAGPAVEIQKLDTADNKESVDESDVNRFTNTIVLIKDFYVQQVGDKVLLDDAIRGMVSGLDPHSEYLDQEAYKTLLMATSGEFGGVGIEVTPEFGVLKIVAPMDDTPAAQGGIKSGDYIVGIEGKLVSEMTLQEAVDIMRGKPGTQVTLTILRKGEKAPLIFKMTREIIRITSVKSKMMDSDFGYIRISQFQEPTPKLMRDAILELKNKNQGRLNGIILDLRNNPGGLLETAVQVVDYFLDSKKLKKFNEVIVYTEGRLP